MSTDLILNCEYLCVLCCAGGRAPNTGYLSGKAGFHGEGGAESAEPQARSRARRTGARGAFRIGKQLPRRRNVASSSRCLFPSASLPRSRLFPRLPFHTVDVPLVAVPLVCWYSRLLFLSFAISVFCCSHSLLFLSSAIPVSYKSFLLLFLSPPIHVSCYYCLLIILSPTIPVFSYTCLPLFLSNPIPVFCYSF